MPWVRTQQVRGPRAKHPSCGTCAWILGGREEADLLRPTGKAMEDAYALGALAPRLCCWAVRAGPTSTTQEPSQPSMYSPLLEKPPIMDIFIPTMLPVPSLLQTASSPCRRDGISAAPLVTALKVEQDMKATAAAKHPGAPEQRENISLAAACPAKTCYRTTDCPK